MPATGPRSKLAKEHNITSAEETEIKEAFALFAQKLEGEKESVMPIGDVRRALMYVLSHAFLLLIELLLFKFQPRKKCARSLTYNISISNSKTRALGLPPSPSELREFRSILDPENEGYTVYRHFVAIAAIKFHSQSRTSDTHRQDVDDAFRLFTHAGQRGGGGGGGGGEGGVASGGGGGGVASGGGRITLATLKRVAQVLKEDVDEDFLVGMLLEANGGKGEGKGVERDEFESVMRRAGMWR